MIEKDSGVKILYVEDDEDIRFNIERLLRRRFSRVVIKKDGKEGLESFFQDKPDIIISDILMPRMTGHQMAEEIRKVDEEIPIIFTTAHSDSEHLLRAIELGITHYVIKPIDREKLFSALEKSRKFVLLEKELEESRTLFSSLSENSVTGVFVYNESFKYINRQFLQFTGYEEEEIKTLSFDDLLHSDYSEKAQEIASSLDAKKRMTASNFECKVVRKDKQEKWLYFAVNYISYKNEFVAMGNVIDITEIKELQKQLEEKALLDNLTRAYNRNGFNEIFLKELTRADRYNIPLSIIMLDIDHFKKINDNYGHIAGDGVLRSLSQVVKDNLRKSDYFVRWGGEEFIILTTDTAVDGAETLAEHIREKVENYNFPDVGKVTISLGVSQKRENEEESVFLNRVDEGLYEAKNSGRNRVVVK